MLPASGPGGNEKLQGLLVFSGVFGKRFSKLHPAPLAGESFLFSNNRELQSEAERTGWSFIFVDKELSNDYRVSSVQSKWVKFLSVMEEYPEIFSGKRFIVYVDHKLKLKKKHVDKLRRMPNPGIIIRTTPIVKNSVYDEFNMSLAQKRYREFKEVTERWISEKLRDGYREQQRVCATGLIAYDLENHNVRKLASEAYQAVLETGNPCCQIFWTVLSQRYEQHIKTIGFFDLDIIWHDPERFKWYHNFLFPPWLFAKKSYFRLFGAPRYSSGTNRGD
jgi:hypothetical protein